MVFALVGVVLLALGVLGFTQIGGPDRRAAPILEIAATPKLLARGEYLVEHVLVCRACHADRDWSRFGGPSNSSALAGGDCLDVADGFPGRVCAPNLSSDDATGIGAWTDGELARAIREGVDRDGEALHPRMPYGDYAYLSDEDLYAVIAYLGEQPAVTRATEEGELSFLARYRMNARPKPVSERVLAPARDDEVAYGEYLARVSGCIGCHSPTDERQDPIAGMSLAGGRPFVGPWGDVLSTNLTPHETGLGNITREDFVARFTETSTVPRPVEAGENTVMPWLDYANMTEADLGAIHAYLQRVAPVPNALPVDDAQ